MRQFTLIVTECQGSHWDAQGMGECGFGPTAFEAIDDWKNRIVMQACDDFILHQKDEVLKKIVLLPT